MTTTEQKVQRPPQRRLTRPFLLILTLLTALILVRGIFEYSGHNVRPHVTKVTPIPITGPFVQPPLNAMQVDSLRHLAEYMPYKQLASLYVSHMTLDEELGQLIMVQYYTSTYSADLEKTINQLHAGGVLLYQWQMRTSEQTKNDISQMQQHATTPLLISTDEEGGYVDRIGNIYPRRPGATEIFDTGDVNVASREGAQTAHDLLALGINTNLAPDIDIPLIKGSDLISRTFGNTANDVMAFAGAYLQAMQSAGVPGCLKHYPGLGDTAIDPHLGLPIINRTREQIYAVELAPYKAFIQSQNKYLHPGMIMATDLLMPAIDPVMPAELSHIFITDILRKELGYDGVITTDALYMQGIAQRWSMPQAAVLALNAGNDMLLGINGSNQMIAVINALKEALKNGTLSKARVDEAVSRILALKMEYHLIPAIPPQ